MVDYSRTISRFFVLLATGVFCVGCQESGNTHEDAPEVVQDTISVSEELNPLSNQNSTSTEALIQADGEESDLNTATSIDDLRQGMPYSEAREIVVSSGWQAVSLSWQDRWTPEGSREQTMYDRGWNELQGCAGSGMGQCRFEFQNVEQQTLALITVGESTDPSLDRWFLE